MNVDIFTCINFREFEEIGNFAESKNRVSIIIMFYVSIYRLFSRCTYFQGFSENAKNMYSAKISTFTVFDFFLDSHVGKSVKYYAKQDLPFKDNIYNGSLI